MTISWHPKDILCICQNEADIVALSAAGYTAVLEPAPEDFGPMPKAEHYIIAANGKSMAIAQGLLAGGLCQPWQVSLNDLGGYSDLTHAADKGGGELVRQIVRKSVSLFSDEVRPFAAVQKREVQTWLTGWPFLSAVVRWSESEFDCFAGPYAGGKSALAQMFAFDFADCAGRARAMTA